MSTDTSIEHEIKIRPSSSTQVKLFASMKSQQLAEFAETLKGMFGLGEYDVEPENRKNVTDDYYDTASLTLFRDHALLRVRRDGGTPKIIAKSMLSHSQGEFKRKEFEQSSTETDLQIELVKHFQSMTELAFPELAEPKFDHVLKVTNERRNYLLKKGAEQYRLSLDTYFFTNPRTGRTSDQLFEIEIESLTSAASENIVKLKAHLAKALSRFSYSHDSKFEAGIKRLRIDRPNWQQFLVEAGSSGGLSWASFAVGVAGLLLGVIGTWITLTAG